ncbi:hypothetical protein [Demequina rhizosphaerae]|nr:hypothetical protein [Demequina rhizosphaerae]
MIGRRSLIGVLLLGGAGAAVVAPVEAPAVSDDDLPDEIDGGRP